MTAQGVNDMLQTMWERTHVARDTNVCFGDSSPILPQFLLKTHRFVCGEAIEIPKNRSPPASNYMTL